MKGQRHIDRHLDQFNPETVKEGTVIWLKGCGSDLLSSFLDKLIIRGLDMIYVGPGDRYQIIDSKAWAHRQQQFS